MAEKMVRVRIRAREMVSYDQIVKLTKKEWKELKGRRAKELTDSCGILGDLLSKDNIDDSLGFEDDFEMEVVDEEGKTKLPLDCFEGS